jgi:conjugal transfer pilus assembly protein TraU
MSLFQIIMIKKIPQIQGIKICLLIVFGLLLVLVSPPSKAGQCSKNFLDITTEINWQCIFPISIGGVIEIGDGQEDNTIDDPVCTCGLDSGLPRIGLNVSFWEPAIVIDTVRDAWCMNAIGTELESLSIGRVDGTIATNSSSSGASDTIFAQMHYYKFPIWYILDMFVDLPCGEVDKGFDIAMMSELLPHWNSPLLSMLLHPEALVFANPVTQLACIADSIAAATGKPIDHLFWCMGSWGNAYPFNGSIGATDRVEANAGIAARAIFMMGRTGLLLDPGVDSCASVYTPIWHKSHYKLQLMRPVKDDACRPIGMTGMGWTMGKNQIQGGGNYSWMVFRKVKCCVGYGP